MGFGWTSRATWKRVPGRCAGEVEIWDYKGTRANSPLCDDYVRQLLTYAALYRDRTGELPVHCVLFFVAGSPDRCRRLLAIDVSPAIVDAEPWN